MLDVMYTYSRRKFLRISSAAAGTAAGAAAIRAAEAVLTGNNNHSRAGIQTIPTFCDICFWKCGAIAYVTDGKLWKVEGNPLDPLCRGRLCPRGTGGIGAHYDPDRLRTPLMRKSSRGNEEWTAVTWDEALNFIAERMQKLKSEYGPEALALFSHGIGGTFLRHALKAYGAINIAAPSFAQCRGPRDVGFRLTFGEDVGSPERTDIRNADCLVLIGSHLGENMHNTQVQEFAEAIGRGASIIVADPRFSIAAGKAKYYVPVKPGTDLALILAWINVLIKEGLYDKDYVSKYGFGFEEFAASVATNTPEWAYPETGIEPDLIRSTAREMARYKPATLVHPGRHVTWYGNDTQRSRAIALLNALLGNWGRKGGFYYPVSMGIPDYPYPAYPKAQKDKADNPGNKFPFANEGLSTGIREATITGKPYPIKGWFVYATNLMEALPNAQETIRAMQNLDLLVVVDVIPSEIAGWADVVLPESVYLERYDDLNVEWFREPFVALRQPVISSPHDQKPNWWIARTLAGKLGLDDYFPWKDIEEYLNHRLSAAGVSFEELKKKGIISGTKQPIYFDEGVSAQFSTPSGKIEFYSLQLEKAGFSPVPQYVHPQDGTDGYLRLLYGRAPVHSFSRTQSNPILSDALQENEVWVHPGTAKRQGIENGTYVRLKNQDNAVSNRIRVRVTERIRPDCVFMVHGFGHTSKGLKHALGKGASDALLITRYMTDPIMGGTGMNVNFVTFEKEGA
jgi:thiosulfate reductase / polysulfide reductase chain A